MIRQSLGALALAAFALPAFSEDAPRVISLGGSVTEIAVALGAEGVLVARDSTSSFPESVLSLPDVGYLRALSPENVLALNPGLIIAEGDAGPPEAVEVLKAAGIPFTTMPPASEPAAIPEKIKAVGAALGKVAEGDALAARVGAELDKAQARADAVADKKTVLFVLSMAGGKMMVAGEGSTAEGIIELSGGENAAKGFSGYKPITDEAIIAAAPDVLLMMDREGDLEVANADILSHPALGETPAAKSGALIRMDGLLLLGLGPRTPQAADELYQAIYGTEG